MHKSWRKPFRQLLFFLDFTTWKVYKLITVFIFGLSRA